VKNPADFIGSYIGQSEANTKGILATTLGKVLVIDEAYMLNSSNGESGNGGDTYKSAVSTYSFILTYDFDGQERYLT